MANYDPNDPRRTDATDPHRPVDPSGRNTVVTETYVEPVEKKASPLPLIIGILLALALAWWLLSRFMGDDEVVVTEPAETTTSSTGTATTGTDATTTTTAPATDTTSTTTTDTATTPATDTATPPVTDTAPATDTATTPATTTPPATDAPGTGTDTSTTTVPVAPATN